MTDNSTKGLLPQLTDVLYALAESHARLLSKVRDLRLEHHGATRSDMTMAEKSAVALIGPSADARLSQRLDIDALPTSDASRETSIDETKPAPSPNAVDPPGVHRVRESATGPDTEDHRANAGGGASPGSAVAEQQPRQEHTDTVLPAQTSPHPDRQDLREVERSHPPRAESDERNYNFFDELDARLAGLEDQDPEQIAE